MADHPTHPCQCPDCLSGANHADRGLHQQMNLLASRLDEQQRRWFAALESRKLRHGGDTRVALILDLHGATVRPPVTELDDVLASPPADRIRNPSAGPTPAKQNIRN